MTPGILRTLRTDGGAELDTYDLVVAGSGEGGLCAAPWGIER
jgi:hypothetical protein